ncbi:MAG TPA: glycine zipper 2TM domain-containing protein [Burkholderiaceae bacterium]|nr:glycine zipper 2TM domain-containing protein [Burkholderiaceae bacterium]
MTRTFTLAVGACALALAAGCSTTHPGAAPVAPVTQSPSASEATQYGEVTNISLVDRPGSASGAGTVLGAVIGGVLGNQVGSGSGRTAATIGGAAAGGFAGHKIEESRAGGSQVYRVDVRFEDGTSRTFDFRDLNGLRVGDRIRWQDGQMYRM